MSGKMAVAGKLTVKRRTEQGSRECRKLREKGLVPGNIYGHKQEAIALMVPAAELEPLVRGGARVLDVELEANSRKCCSARCSGTIWGKKSRISICCASIQTKN